jgi:hypothetical protein
MSLGGDRDVGTLLSVQCCDERHSRHRDHNRGTYKLGTAIVRRRVPIQPLPLQSAPLGSVGDRSLRNHVSV